MSSKSMSSASYNDPNEPPSPPSAGQGFPSSPTKAPNPSSFTRKFSQHPIVSTILWLLGTENQPLPVSAENDDDKRSTLSWSDQRGGYLQEYISSVQSAGENVGGDKAGGGERNQEAQTLKPGQQRRRATKASQQEVEADQESGSEGGASPAWGFYISITPPMQEMVSITIYIHNIDI